MPAVPTFCQAGGGDGKLLPDEFQMIVHFMLWNGPLPPSLRKIGIQISLALFSKAVKEVQVVLHN